MQVCLDDYPQSATEIRQHYKAEGPDSRTVRVWTVDNGVNRRPHLRIMVEQDSKVESLDFANRELSDVIRLAQVPEEQGWHPFIFESWLKNARRLPGVTATYWYDYPESWHRNTASELVPPLSTS